MPARYTIGSLTVNDILVYIKNNRFSIPLLQRPFVWDSSKVRDLVDSMYRGYPIGFVILWGNPSPSVKGGGTNNGRLAIIDGQQRITAIATALGGVPVVNKNYHSDRIIISFDPFDDSFKVMDATTKNNARCITDISDAFGHSYNVLNAAKACCEAKLGANPPLEEIEKINDAITRLTSILGSSIGVIYLDGDLESDQVNSVFSRINSGGMKLSKYDFIMSKLATDESHGGQMIQKTIDNFCHILRDPKAWSKICNDDPAFASSEYGDLISWASARKSNISGIYVPRYEDVIQTAFLFKFGSGWTSNLPSLLDGRDFSKKTYSSKIADESFLLFDDGVRAFVKDSNFKGFIDVLKDMGAVNGSIIRSKYVLNFGYALYLLLKSRGYKKTNYIVKRWIALSAITGRYASYPGYNSDQDIRSFHSSESPSAILRAAEDTALTDSFWSVELPRNMETSSASSPLLGIFLAALSKTNCECFLRNGTNVTNLLTGSSCDLHHVFPKNYLIKSGFADKTQYNQMANMICMDSLDNKTIGDS